MASCPDYLSIGWAKTSWSREIGVKSESDKGKSKWSSVVES
jgi:hypothetical protein